MARPESDVEATACAHLAVLTAPAALEPESILEQYLVLVKRREEQ